MSFHMLSAIQFFFTKKDENSKRAIPKTKTFYNSFNTLPPEMILINFFGISIVVYGTLIVYLVTKFEYARKDD